MELDIDIRTYLRFAPQLEYWNNGMVEYWVLETRLPTPGCKGATMPADGALAGRNGIVGYCQNPT